MSYKWDGRTVSMSTFGLWSAADVTLIGVADGRPSESTSAS
jgi:hypothetical protein